MKRIIFGFACIAVVLLYGGYASASTIASYTFDASTGAATGVATEITASNLTSSDGSVTYVNGNPSSGKAIEDNGWKSAGNYYYFTVTPTAGFQLNVAGLQFNDYYLSGSGGPTAWQTYYGFSGNTGSFTASTTGSTHTSWATDTAMSGGLSALQNTTNSITFRIAATGASNDGTGRRWALDNVILNGDTQALADLGTAVTTAPSAKCLVGTSGVQYVLRTTNNALSGGTTAAQTLDYTLGFASQTGLSFASNNGNGVGRGNSNNNIINVNTSTSGTKGGTINVASTNAYHQNVSGALSNVDVYQAAALTITGGSSLNIANANTSDGGQRAAARLTTMTKTVGDSALGITGLTAGGHGSGSVISQNSNVNGTAVISGNVLNGVYSATYQLGFEHDDQTIAGTGNNDLGTFTRNISKTVTANSGNQSVTLDSGRLLAGLWAKSDKAEGTAAYLMDGTLSAQRTISTSWRNAIAGENHNGFNLYSDVLTLNGTGSDIFVLQMAYDTSLLPVIGTAIPQLGWLKDGQWVNAVEGNTEGTSHFVNAAYDSQYFALGNYGIDTAHNVVWAVINHNSDFSVVPEPATIAILALGGLSLMRTRKR